MLFPGRSSKILSTKWNSSPYTFEKLARVTAIYSLLLSQIWILIKRFLIATYSQIYEWIQLTLVSIASLCQQLNLALRLWCGKPASCVPFSVFPILYNFAYHRIENNTGISMCAVMINRKTLSCKQMCLFPVCKNLLIVPFHLSFFLLTAPISSLVILFSMETKPSLEEGNCEIRKLLRKIFFMIFQTWFN